MLLVCQIYDVPAENYLAPTYFRDYTDFVRSLINNELNNSESFLYKYASDYRVIFQYTFDEDSGEFTSLGKKIDVSGEQLLCLFFKDVENKIFRKTSDIVEDLLHFLVSSESSFGYKEQFSEKRYVSNVSS